MAGLRLHVPTGEVSLSSGTAKTVFTLTAPSNHRVLIRGIEVFFKGTSPTDTPVKIEISRITTDGGTASSPTVAKNDENAGESPLSTVKSAYTAEPSTYGNNMKTWEVHPQTGLINWFPPGAEIVVKGGNEIGIRMTAAAAQTVSCNVYYEE